MLATQQFLQSAEARGLFILSLLCKHKLHFVFTEMLVVFRAGHSKIIDFHTTGYYLNISSFAGNIDIKPVLVPQKKYSTNVS